MSRALRGSGPGPAVDSNSNSESEASNRGRVRVRNGTGQKRSDPWQKNTDPEAVRYFTPPWLLSEVYELFAPDTGDATRVDLDPCKDPEAFVSATVGYDIRAGQDGLALPWNVVCPVPGTAAKWTGTPGAVRDAVWGPGRIATVFCNPPYDKPTPWLARAARHYEDGGQAILLVNAAPGTRAWREHVFGCPGALVCFLARRVTFYKCGVGYEGPNNRDSAVIYYGPHPERFYAQFSKLGTIVAPWSPPAPVQAPAPAASICADCDTAPTYGSGPGTGSDWSEADA